MLVEGQHWLLPASAVNDDDDGWDSRQISCCGCGWAGMMCNLGLQLLAEVMVT